jgi:hypothetical protein
LLPTLDELLLLLALSNGEWLVGGCCGKLAYASSTLNIGELVVDADDDDDDVLFGEDKFALFALPLLLLD